MHERWLICIAVHRQTTLWRKMTSRLPGGFPNPGATTTHDVPSAALARKLGHARRRQRANRSEGRMSRAHVMFAGVIVSGLAAVLALHHGDLRRTAVAAGILVVCAIGLEWHR